MSKIFLQRSKKIIIGPWKEASSQHIQYLLHNKFSLNLLLYIFFVTQSYKLDLSRQVFFFWLVFTTIAAKMIPRTWNKNSLERRVPRFCTICDKNQLLKVKIDKVSAILVPSSGGSASCRRHRARRKSLYGSMVDLKKKINCKFFAPRRPTGNAQYVVTDDVSDLFWNVASGRPRQIVWGIFTHLVFLITFPKIIACSWNSLYRRVSTSATICDKKLGSKIFLRKYGYFTLHTKTWVLVLDVFAPVCKRGAVRVNYQQLHMVLE
jgi:hypothetical protein